MLNSKELNLEAVISMAEENGFEISNMYGLSDEEFAEVIATIVPSLEEGEYLVVSELGREDAIRDEIGQMMWAFIPSFILDHVSDKEEFFENLANEFHVYEYVNYSDEVELALSKFLENKCESANDFIVENIDDFDEFVEDAVSHDGYGHFLNRYNGEEYELNINGITYYAYRTN